MRPTVTCRECGVTRIVHDLSDPTPPGWEITAGGKETTYLCDACRPDIPASYQQAIAALVDAADETLSTLDSLAEEKTPLYSTATNRDHLRRVLEKLGVR